MNSSEIGPKNIKSMTKLELLWLSASLVEIWTVGLEIYNWKELVMSISVSLWIEWYRNKGSYKLSLILKSSVMMKTLLMLILVSLRYFKANCDESEYTFSMK